MNFKTELKVSGTEPNLMEMAKRFPAVHFEAKREGKELHISLEGPLQDLQEVKRRLGGKRNRVTHVEVISLCTPMPP